MGAGPCLGAPRSLAVQNTLQVQSTVALQLRIIASADTNTFLFEIYADLVPNTHLLNSQALVSRFTHPVRESGSNLCSRPKAWLIS